MLLGRLGASYRTDDPARSLEYYRQAAEIQPEAAEYALGYAAALVQARRFPEAAAILRQVVSADPDNYVAHANLATALYESKRYRKQFLNMNGYWLPNRKSSWPIISLPPHTIILENTRKHSHRMKSF